MVNRKELRPEDGPRAAYGAHLRRLRERRSWTQEELAGRTSYSSQHVSAVETARKPPTLPFSRELDQVFGTVGTADSLERLWSEMRYGNLLEGFSEYVAYEGRAVEIRSFHLGIIPGLLQTPGYAQALANSHVRRGSLTQQQADERVAFLMERQGALVKDRPPMLLVVMDESCIRRPVGGPDAMRAQLERLVEFAELPNSVFQVAPYEMGERRPFDLPVNLLTLADRSMIAYAETHAQGHVERERTAVVSLLTTYHQLQAECLSQADSVAMVEQVRKGMS
ncbi:helix-turn-helix transcriptional regulator [Streptomyces sp. SKN60]|uniref:helix-turn-helix domain-containing protein n=1 Tax=Streptomyces sp. SKN60 TaxID=2855506 RepID=UPI0022472688|nr:helix-turn-helix transcriptional regulator [Streptomyces sp. SKN60]MCX2179895.1 helix-turn-helix transcriptional regulator [Streptomyces sp. SKN60]